MTQIESVPHEGLESLLNAASKCNNEASEVRKKLAIASNENEALENDLQNVKDGLQAMHTPVSELVRKQNELSSILSNLCSSQDARKLASDQFEDELKKDQQRFTLQEQNVVDLPSKLKLLLENANQSKEECAEMLKSIAKVQEEMAKVAEQIRDHEKENTHLDSVIESVSRDSATVSRKLAKLHESEKEQAREIQQHEEEISASKDLRTKLIDECQSLTSAHQIAQEELERKKEAVDSLCKRLSLPAADDELAKQQLALHETEITKAQEDLRCNEQALTAARDIQKQLEMEIQAIEVENDRLLRDSGEHSQSKPALEQDIKHKQQQLDELLFVLRLSAQRKQIKALSIMIKELKEQYGQQKGNLSSVHQIEKKIHDEHEHLREEEKKNRQEVQSLNRQLSNVDEECKQITRRAGHLKNSMVDTTKELRRLTEQKLQLESQSEASTRKLAEIQSAKQENVKQTQETEKKMHDVQKQISNISDQIAGLRSAHAAQLQNDSAQANTTYEKHRENVLQEIYHKEIPPLCDRYNELEKKLELLNQQFEESNPVIVSPTI